MRFSFKPSPVYPSILSSLILFLVIIACSRVDVQPAQPLNVSPVQNEMTGTETPIIISDDINDADQQAATDEVLTTSISSTVVTPIPASTVPAYTPTTLPPDFWMSLPIIPTVSQTSRDIYQRGIMMGRDPHVFSKVGDCQSISTYFLKYFDIAEYYKLGKFSSLQSTIDWYSGSFSRDSMAVKGGFNAAAILSPLRADPLQCDPAENPIACELRLHNPSVAIVSLEEWWAGHPENYERYMRQIIEYLIQQNVVPIIATKADNLEGKHLINQTIAKLALEYDIPLWNFWLAVQALPNHGLIEVNSLGEIDRFHLTHSEGYYLYDDPNAVLSGWSIRNLTALQVLDALRRGLAEQP